MGLDILALLAGAIVSLATGAVIFSEEVHKFLRKIFRVDKQLLQRAYGERLATLSRDLVKASTEVDAILVELTQVAQSRELACQQVEANLKTLEGKERTIQERIEVLENVPIPAANQFAEILEERDRRSALRDYVLFGAGVVVSTAIAIGLKFVGLG